MGLNLQAFVSLDGSGFSAGLAKLEHGAARFGETVKGLALTAFGVYGIESAIAGTVEKAAKLLETANRLGIGTERFQELAFGAKQSGLEIEELTTLIDKLNKNRIDPKMLPHFQRLGIQQPSIGDVGDLVMKLSLAARTQSSQVTSGPLQQVGGRGAAAAINFLNENLEELAKKAHEVGEVIKTDDLVALKFLQDEASMLAMVLTAQLAPALVNIMNKVIQFINSIQASGTFWGKLTGPGFWEQFAEMFKRGAKLDASGRTAFERRFVEAGASSQTVLEELNDNSAEMIKHLQDEQKAREQRNKVGADQNISDPLVPKHHETKFGQIQTDSLLRVGNFLGSSSHPLLAVNHQQLHVAHQQLAVQREIARNTQWRPVGHGAYPPH